MPVLGISVHRLGLGPTNGVVGRRRWPIPEPAVEHKQTEGYRAPDQV